MNRILPKQPRLRLDPELYDRLREQVLRGFDGLKPGWTRVSLCYTDTDAVADYIAEAVTLVADEGWKLLPDYQFDPHTVYWRHRLDTCLSLSLAGFPIGPDARPPGCLETNDAPGDD